MIINVGRGPVIDQAAMVRALNEKRIKGAGLDVFEQEPLPAGDPMYQLENVLLSPTLRGPHQGVAEPGNAFLHAAISPVCERRAARERGQQEPGILDSMDERKKLRSDCGSTKTDPGEAAVYLERYGNYGITREELQSGRPMIGIAQSGSDLVPCNRIHDTLVERVKAGIRDAGGLPFEFPTYPIQETGKRPTAALDRNLAYLSLVEILPDIPSMVWSSPRDATRPPPRR